MAAPAASLVDETVRESALRHLDAASLAAVSEAARRETRNREVHLPPVSAYRWWARRTRAVNDALLRVLERDLGERLTVLDPFSGGGVIPLAAALRGHEVFAQDIDPWAAFGLDTLRSLPKARALLDVARDLEEELRPLIERAYATHLEDGTAAECAHTLRVLVARCRECRERLRLFPHALVTLLRRKERGDPRAILACARGHLFQASADARARCPVCSVVVEPRETYLAHRLARCFSCGASTRLSDLAGGAPLEAEVVVMDRAAGRRREIGLAARDEASRADDRWSPERSLGPIPEGAEARVLLRHGYGRFEDLYPPRQRALLEALLDRIVSTTEAGPLRSALVLAATNTAEMAGRLSRWDRFYLKSYEAMAGHRFNFTTLPAEPHVFGAGLAGRGTFRRRVAQLARVSSWLEEHLPKAARVHVSCGGSERLPHVPDGSVDVALTDPPYHDDVSYSELSRLLRAWAGLASSDDDSGAPFGERLALVFAEVRRKLRPGGHLLFSFANRDPEGWAALFAALHAAGFEGAGFTVVHSENERDAVKRGVRACQLDLILDVVPRGGSVRFSAPAAFLGSEEEAFLHIAGRYLEELARWDDGARARFIAALKAAPFLAPRASAPSGRPRRGARASPR